MGVGASSRTPPAIPHPWPTRGAQGRLADAGRGGGLSPEVAEGLEALAASSSALLEQIETSTPDSAAEAFEQLLAEVDRLREEVPAGEEAAKALDQAEELFEAAQLALETDAPGEGESGVGGASSTDEGGQEGRGSPLRGTMSGLDQARETATEGLSQQSWDGPEGALGPGTHWPEEHRGVVRRWIEETRSQETSDD